ncbi:MAG: ribosome biogenesis GTPase Der, partial [Sphingobacteriia bacterium]|nr:ribosome biogenesis GTPase Der [Sphingobacteriia bacterium]
IKLKLHDSLQQVKGVPVVTISAKKGEGIDLLMKEVFHIYTVWDKRVQTHQLNKWLCQMTEAHPPPVAKNGRRIPMRYMTQVNTRPPTFVIFSSNPDELPESYLRYLSNGLRDDFGLTGVPIRINMRKRINPYADKSRRK